MKNLAKISIVFMMFSTLLIFYMSGIARFPDYENYLLMAENTGFVVSQHDYMFEWVSRFLLRVDGFSAENRVFLVAIVSQAVCVLYFGWLLCKSDSNRVYGALLLFSMFGFLFVTTTLRGATAYLCISVFFLRNARLDSAGIALLLFSIAWHDSAAPVAFFAVVASSVESLYHNSYAIKRNLSIILIGVTAFSAVLVFIAGPIRSVLPSLIGIDFGARAAYFDGDGGYSFSKTVFLLFVVFCCYKFVCDIEQSKRSRIFMALMALLVGFVNSISSVIAVRFAFFIFSVILPLRGVFLDRFERSPTFRLTSLVISPVIFYLSIEYVLSNKL